MFLTVSQRNLLQKRNGNRRKQFMYSEFSVGYCCHRAVVNRFCSSQLYTVKIIILWKEKRTNRKWSNENNIKSKTDNRSNAMAANRRYRTY